MTCSKNANKNIKFYDLDRNIIEKVYFLAKECEEK